MRFWFPVEYGSIYAVLRTLERQGYVRALAPEQEGQRPARTRYEITREGREQLQDLLRRAWRELSSPAEPFQLALAARSELAEVEVVRLLAERAEGLRERLEQLERLERSAPAAAMVERSRALTEAELQWVENEIGKEDS